MIHRVNLEVIRHQLKVTSWRNIVIFPTILLWHKINGTDIRYLLEGLWTGWRLRWPCHCNTWLLHNEILQHQTEEQISKTQVTSL